MKTKALNLALAALITSVVGLALVAPKASAATLTCSILPAKLCSQATQSSSGSPNSSNSAVFMLLEWVLAILTAGVGLAAVVAFVYAGIMYSSASNKPEQVKKAKDIMTQTVIGLVAFAVMALAITWLIPGGIF